MRWLVFLTLVGCGRVNFDARGDGGLAIDDSTAMTADAFAIPNLVAWWPLDDDLEASSTARDIGGNGLDASCIACPSRALGRGAGFALRFDGVDDILSVPSGALLANNRFTAAGWVSLERRPSIVEILVSKAVGLAGENSFALSQAGNGRAEFYSEGNSSLQSPAALPLSSWVHLALTFDGVTKRLYVNGVSAGTMVAAAALTYDNQPLTIGGDIENNVPGFFLQGTIADVMLFDRDLADTEIQLLAAP